MENLGNREIHTFIDSGTIESFNNEYQPESNVGSKRTHVHICTCQYMLHGRSKSTLKDHEELVDCEC